MSIISLQKFTKFCNKDIKKAKVFRKSADIYITKGTNYRYRKMGINITHTMNSFQFENRENLRNAAKQILNKQGASTEAMHKIVEQTVFPVQNSQQLILNMSSQVTLNNSLKETLKYLKSQANKKTVKEPVLGELWDIMNKKTIDNYTGELQDFEIDENAKNIFEAA